MPSMVTLEMPEGATMDEVMALPGMAGLTPHKWPQPIRLGQGKCVVMVEEHLREMTAAMKGDPRVLSCFPDRPVSLISPVGEGEVRL